MTGHTGRVAVAERLACRKCPSPEAAPRATAWAWALGRAESGLGTIRRRLSSLRCPVWTPHAGSAGGG